MYKHLLILCADSFLSEEMTPENGFSKLSHDVKCCKKCPTAVTRVSFFSLKRLTSPIHVNILPNVIDVSITEDQSKKISNDQELIQSDPTFCPINQKGNN